MFFWLNLVVPHGALILIKPFPPWGLYPTKKVFHHSSLLSWSSLCVVPPLSLLVQLGAFSSFNRVVPKVTMLFTLSLGLLSTPLLVVSAN